MADYFFLRIIQLKYWLFSLFFFVFLVFPSSPHQVSQVITVLFLQFMLSVSSFVGALKNEIPEAALELCWLKIKQLSADILKFRTKHEDVLLL